MKLGFLYAGQGSQHPGMGADLYEAYPAFRAVIDSAQVDFDLKEVSFTDSQGVINQTRYTQPCMVAFAAGLTAVLREQGVTYSDTMELGIMIETPAAAIISDRLAPMVDFFSVGTNDLTQYTLACDRQNPDIEPFIDTHHEAILRLIEMSARNAHANGAWIGICGELAADTTLTETFLRMGIDELSVSPAFVLKVRDAVRNVDLRK